MDAEIQLEASWKEVLGEEFSKPYMQKLKQFLRLAKDQKKNIYPKSKNIFSAFKLTPIDKVKVVILGQDPYHGPNQAHGLCFSVLPGISLPPSLVNIYKELHDDLGIPPAKHGFLEHWAKQGVLLLNSVLTVEKGIAAAHSGQGWEQFTDYVIKILNEQDRAIVFVLWGSYAQKKGQIVDLKKHIVLKTTHPSPLSAYRGFLGSKQFSKINEHLKNLNQEPIDWQLPEKQLL